MDINLITAAHLLPDNQFGFDQEALERAVLCAEKRRTKMRTMWLRTSSQITLMVEYLELLTNIATPKRSR